MPCQNAPPDNIALLVKFQYLNFPYFFRTNLSKVPGRIRQSNCLRLAGKHGRGHADTDTDNADTDNADMENADTDNADMENSDNADTDNADTDNADTI